MNTMVEGNDVIISTDILNSLFREFTEFLQSVANENFVSFKTSAYLDEQENYKYSIFYEAKQHLGNKYWKQEDVGTGKIQKAIDSAILKKVIHNNKNVDNNLIHWIQKDNYSKLAKDRNLEQLFFDFYKNKITPQNAFQELTKHFDYQLIAYLFFITDKNQFLPISQKVFDRIISEKLQIADFKTTGQISWDNYKIFLEIVKQVHRFLRTKVKDAELLDAHSFLWILGRQREDWVAGKSSTQEVSTLENKLSERRVFKIGKESLQSVSVKENRNEIEINKTEIGSLERLSSKQFTPADIIWIKNVTNKETGRAYMDLSSGKFILHFPNQHIGNIGSPRIGEIILLRQKINETAVFTHLVTPIDNETVDSNEHPLFRYGRRVQIIAKTPLDDLIEVSSTDWKNINFSGVSQGNACKIENIKDIKQIDELQFEIWKRFTPFFMTNQLQSVEETLTLINEIENSDETLTVKEGKLRLVAHYARERNPEIIRLKKQKAIANNSLYCEVCKFSFIDFYNVEFIECHHRTPIAETGETETRLEDLALVCANCHRMLHKKINGQFLSMEILKSIYEQNKHLLNQ